MIPGIVASPMAAPAVVVATTWDPLLKHADITLSNGNLDATKPAGGVWRTVLGNKGKATGKWQFEVLCVTTSGNQIAGVADRTSPTSVINGYLGSGPLEAVGHALSALYASLSGGGGTTGTTLSWGAGDVMTFALDLEAATPTLQMKVNGATERTINLPTGKTWYPACSVENANKMRLIPSALTYGFSGYSEWD